MSDEKESVQVSRWKERLSVSKKFKESCEQTGGWKRFIKQYKGEYDVIVRTPAPPIGEVYAYVNSGISFLNSRNPYITVNAKKTGTVMGARILEMGVNYFWRELKIKEQIKKELFDAFLVGHAWHKSGMDVRLSGSGDLLRLDSDKMFSTRVSWKDMFFNAGAVNVPHDCRWLANRILLPIDELKKQFGKAASKIKGVTLSDIQDKNTKDLLFKDDVRYGVIYEIHSAADKQIFLVADEMQENYLADPKPWPDYLENYPYDFLQFNPINDEPYGLSDIQPIEPQILEKIKIFTMALNHIKRWNRQMLMKKGAMADSEKDKYEMGLDGTILDVNGDPNTIGKLLDYGSLPPDIYLTLDRLDAIRRTVSGMPEFFQGGITKTNSRTDGELDKISDGASSRMQLKVDALETHMANIARNMMANMMHQFPVETAVKITGKEPKEVIDAFKNMGRYDEASQSIMFTSDDIKGEYDLEVKAGSTLPLDKGTRDQVLDRLIDQSITLASAPSIPPFMEELLKERLRAYDMPALEEAFVKQQEAVAQNAQAEQAVRDVEIEKTKAETDKRIAQANQIDSDTTIEQTRSVLEGLNPGEDPAVALQNLSN